MAVRTPIDVYKRQVVQIDNMQDVQELTFVLVKSLNLYIEDGAVSYTHLHIWQVPTLQVVRCISACIYAAFKRSISEWSFFRSA